MPSGGGSITDNFIPSRRSAFLPASMYKDPSDTYFTWKRDGFPGVLDSLGDCAFKGAGNVPTSSQAARNRNVLNAGVALMLAAAAVLVAVVASGGAVDEVAHAVVLVSRLGLLVRSSGVAVDAGKARIIGGDLMAIIANGAMMRNNEVRMVESGAEPGCGCVAGIAGCRIPGRDMVGNCTTKGLCTRPGCLVTAVAGGICGGQGIVVVHVAIGAAHDFRASRRGHLVGARECPTRGAVIKPAVDPGCRVVAGGA